MPSSRATRKTIRHGNVASAAEWRLRAEMGAEMPVDDDYASSAVREQMKRGRAALHSEFKKLARADRVRRADEFKRKLRALCPSPRAYKGAWEATFAPLLAEAPSGRRVPARTGDARNTPPAPGRAPRATTPATAGPSPKTPARRDPQRAARALDVKLRVARPNDDAAVARLVAQLNADRHFLEAFGRPVTAQDVKEQLENVGQYRSRGARSAKKNKAKKPR